MKKLLSMTEVAGLTGLSRWTLRYWMRKGQGPPFKRTPGGRYLFRERDIHQWLDCLEDPAFIEASDRKESAAA